HAENLAIGGHGGYRDDAPTEGFAQDVDVRHDVFVVAGEGLSGTAQSGLDLVGGEQHVVGGAEFTHATQIAVRWDDHSGLTLDRLDQYRNGSSGVRGDGLAHGGEVAVGHRDEAWGVGPEVV